MLYEVMYCLADGGLQGSSVDLYSNYGCVFPPTKGDMEKEQELPATSNPFKLKAIY